MLALVGLMVPAPGSSVRILMLSALCTLTKKGQPEKYMIISSQFNSKRPTRNRAHLDLEWASDKMTILFVMLSALCTCNISTLRIVDTLIHFQNKSEGDNIQTLKYGTNTEPSIDVVTWTNPCAMYIICLNIEKRLILIADNSIHSKSPTWTNP